MASTKRVGTVTRGTTNPNRLRRVDRFIASLPVVKTQNAVVVDLGYGASPITAVELLARCKTVNPNTRLVGVEIERERVERGLAVATDDLRFTLGGFETPLPADFGAGTRVDIIRAFNVLRQYDEPEVAGIWVKICSRLAPGGIFIDGTCDEIGRVSTWVALSPDGPETFSVSLRLADLESPSIAAERLVKALIHRNVPGENINRFFGDLDRQWATHAGIGALSPVQRWVATVRGMKDLGWPVHDNQSRWRLGEITVDWDAVAPLP